MSCVRNGQLLLLCAALLHACLCHGAESEVRQTAQSIELQRTATEQEFDTALAVLDAGDMHGALPLWRRLAEHAPEASTPLANLAVVQLQLENLDGAEKSVNEAIARHPEAAYYNLLGVIQRHKVKFIAARQSYERAIELDGNYPDAHLNLAILCELYLQDYHVALQHYRRYLEIVGADKDQRVAGWASDLERRTR